MTLIDTAEMYGDGAANVSWEKRSGVGADEDSSSARCCPPTPAARYGCRLRTQPAQFRHRLRRSLPSALARGYPLAETVAAFEELKKAGKIRAWGVYQFRRRTNMEELSGVPDGGNVAANQVLYNLARRGIEFDLLPVPRSRRAGHGLLTARRGRLLHDADLIHIARRIRRRPRRWTRLFEDAFRGDLDSEDRFPERAAKTATRSISALRRKISTNSTATSRPRRKTRWR